MSGKKQRGPSSLGEMTVELLKHSIGQETVDVKVGDKVLIKEGTHVSYLIPIGSKEMVGKNYERINKGLSKYFTQVEGIVTYVNQNFLYNCGHCSQEHKHDIIVYYKEINQSFHTDSHAVTLVSE